MRTKVISYVVAQIEAIQQELEQLRKTLTHQAAGRKTKLRGLWKGIEVTEEDIAEAKKSVFRVAYRFKE